MAAAFEELPNEVLYNVFLCVPPSTVPVLQRVCRKFNGISQPLLWRHHCRTVFRYWSPERGMPDNFNGDVNKVNWKKIFSERHQLAHQVDHGINDILSTQRGRLAKVELLVSRGYDAKDALLRSLNVEDSATDVLARRYYSDTVLGLLHRNIAIQQWVKLSKGEEISLERALAGFDFFVLHGRRGDYYEISATFDSIAEMFRQEVQGFAEMNTRLRARTLADYLISHNLVSIKCNVNENYHNLQNNFLAIALQDPDHPSLPLISVAIYCCVAQRLGLDAQPCGFPFHVLAIVRPPTDRTAGGNELHGGQLGDPIYMDPFRSASETPVENLKSQLLSLGIAPDDHATYLGPSSTAEIVRRSAKNIITSAQTSPWNHGTNHLPTHQSFPEIDDAFYASLWALIILAEGDRDAANAQRAQFVPYIIQRIESRFSMDVSIVEKYLVPLFTNMAQYDEIINSSKAIRENDAAAPREVKLRTFEMTESVRFKVGQYFQHKRYSYFGVITGWDVECLAGEAWILRMGVEELSRGKHQSFYHVTVEDGSRRYVAEENVKALDHQPSQGLMELAGQYFKRWDRSTKMFISNIRDEYPHD